MKQQDWIDYFEAVNGRSPEPAELEAARLAGEFLTEEVVSEAVAPAPPVETVYSEAATAQAAYQQQAGFTVPPTNAQTFAQPNNQQQPPLQFQQGPVTPNQQVYTMQVAVPSSFSLFWGQFWTWLKAAWQHPTVDGPTHKYNGVAVYTLLVLFTTLTNTMPLIKGGMMNFSDFLTIFLGFGFVFFAFILGGFIVKRVVYKEEKFTFGYSFEWFGRLLSLNLALMVVAAILSFVNVHTLSILLTSISYSIFFSASGYTLYHTENHSNLDMYYKYIIGTVLFTIVMILFIIIGVSVAGEMLLRGLAVDLNGLFNSYQPFGY